MPTQKVFESILSGTLHGQFVQTVLNWQCNVGTPVNAYTDAEAFLSYLNDTSTFFAAFLSCLPEDYTLTSVRVKQVFPTGGPTVILLGSGVTGGTVGARAGEISSAQVNPLVTWIGELRPSNTGRTFLPGVSEDDIDGMMLTSTLVTDIMAMIDIAVTPPTNTMGNTSLCVFTRRRTTPVVVAAAWDKVIAGQISPLIGTQRGRLHPV